jgi:quinol monooxygenase YgiN
MTTTEPLCWLARISPRPGKADALRAVLREMVLPSRAEPGCLAYALHESGEGEAKTFCFYEIWRGRADHQAHMRSPHLQAFLARRDELVEAEIAIEPLVLLEP